MAIAIGLVSCSEFPNGCASVDVTEVLGDVLYAGPYSPQRHEAVKPPYQNFSLYIPESFTAGEASLAVAHFVLTGVSDFFIGTDGSADNLVALCYDSGLVRTHVGCPQHHTQRPIKLRRAIFLCCTIFSVHFLTYLGHLFFGT